MNRREFLTSSFKCISTLPLANLIEGTEERIEKAKEERIIISGAGDVTLGFNFPYMFNNISKLYGVDCAFDYPFLNVRNVFANSDLAIVNLEGALTKSDKARPKKFNFKGDPAYARCLNEGNIDIVNLANNHFMDYSEEGALETIDSLNFHKINYCGGGINENDSSFLKVINRKGINVGFLGFAQVGRYPPAGRLSAGTNPFDNDSFDKIKNSKYNCDILVISCHWGIERKPFPENYQVSDARKMIDSGADIVFGHHPHIIQGIEEYNGGIIFYSLGNFIFGGNSFPSDRDSFIAQVECSKNKVELYNVVPVITHPSSMVFQPYIPKNKGKIIGKITQRSKI